MKCLPNTIPEATRGSVQNVHVLHLDINDLYQGWAGKANRFSSMATIQQFLKRVNRPIFC